MMLNENLLFWSLRWAKSVNSLLENHSVVEIDKFIRMDAPSQQQCLINMLNTVDVFDINGDLPIRLSDIVFESIEWQNELKVIFDEKFFERLLLFMSKLFSPFNVEHRCLYQNDEFTLFLNTKSYQAHSIVYELYFLLISRIWKNYGSSDVVPSIMVLSRPLNRGNKIALQMNCAVNFSCASHKLVFDFSNVTYTNSKKQKKYLQKNYQAKPQNIYKVVEIITRSKVHEGKVAFDFVANHIPMKTRTIQEKLKSLGYSYRHIKEKVMLEHCNLLLINTEEKLDFIAKKLGFGSASNFCRAYKKWTGLSPADFRRHFRELKKIESKNSFSEKEKT